MFIYLFASLVLTASGKCEELTQELRNSKMYAICLISSNSESCMAMQETLLSYMQSCIVESNILSDKQSIIDFVEGFYNGIQADASNPSSCVKSFILVKSSYSAFFKGFNEIGFTPLVNGFFNFNDVVNQLSTSYGLCNFSTLYNIFHPGTVWKFFSSVFSHILMNQNGFTSTWGKFINALDAENYVSAGIYFGKVFTIVTGYSL